MFINRQLVYISYLLCEHSFIWRIGAAGNYPNYTFPELNISINNKDDIYYKMFEVISIFVSAATMRIVVYSRLKNRTLRIKS